MEINNLATTIESPNYEKSVCEVITSDGGTKVITIIASELSSQELSTYTEYVMLFADKTSITITNSDEQFTVTRMTSFEVTDEVVTLDYESLSNLDQEILHNFYNLVLSK